MSVIICKHHDDVAEKSIPTMQPLSSLRGMAAVTSVFSLSASSSASTAAATTAAVSVAAASMNSRLVGALHWHCGGY
jgi:hypothetical protein